MEFFFFIPTNSQNIIYPREELALYWIQEARLSKEPELVCFAVVFEWTAVTALRLIFSFFFFFFLPAEFSLLNWLNSIYWNLVDTGWVKSLENIFFIIFVNQHFLETIIMLSSLIKGQILSGLWVIWRRLGAAGINTCRITGLRIAVNMTV